MSHHMATLLDDTVHAVVSVHYAGVACDIAGIGALLLTTPAVSAFPRSLYPPSVEVHASDLADRLDGTLHPRDHRADVAEQLRRHVGE
jgi:hypothetical protein